MKARSATLMLLYYEPGTHEAVTRWHNEIHRPEMQATIPHIYHSDDWVAPLEYMALRPPTDLNRRGGEYLCLYWSEGTAEELQEGVRQYAEATAQQGRYHPHQEIVWRERLHVISGHVRPGLEVTVDTVPLLRNTGVLATIAELADADRADECQRWYETVHVPRMLDSGMFSGHYALQPMGEAGHKIYVDLYFVEREEPLQMYEKLQDLEAAWKQKSDGLGDMESLRRPIFSGLYRPIVPDQYNLFYR